MNKLITQCLEEQNVSFLMSLPVKVLNKSEIKWIDFIKQYVLLYNVPPTVERLEKEFNDFIRAKSSDPLGDTYVQEVGKRRNTLTRESLIKNQGLLTNGDDPFNFINSLVKELEVPSEEILSAADFDATEYMRKYRRNYFGLPYIDDITGGISDGDLVYLFGRPGSGKTSVLIHLIARWALQGLNVLVVSNEIKYVDLMYKIHATIAGVDQSAKRKGTLTTKDISKIRIAQNILSVSNNLFVVKHPVNSVYSITPLLSERKVDVLCIDGVYLMSTNGKASSDWQELTEVSRYLKQTANNMNMSIVGVVQGSRASENGVTASGVAGSDAFLQDADILLGIEKEGVSVGYRTVGLKCVKNRNGIPGNCSLSISFPIFSVWENEE